MLGESVVNADEPRNRRGRVKVALAVLAACVVACSIGAPSALALSPSVGTKAASNVDYSTATLNGTVNPNGLATKAYFEYGPTTSYGTKTAEVSVGSGSSALETAKAVTGLTPNTTYHYRIVASNSDGTSTGGDRTFHVGWKVESLAETGTQMFDVSCGSPTMCMAVRDSGVIRWNGSEWTSQTLTMPAGGKSLSAHAVSCPSASACVVVGSYSTSSEYKTLVETWNGSEWKVQASPTPASFGNFESVSCPSAGECSAVGSDGGSKTFAMRWNGSEWSLQTTVNPGAHTYLKSVSCVSSSFCMAAGFYNEGSEYIPMAQLWNGTEWSLKAPVKPSGTTRSWLYGISCVSSSACWAVGPKEVVPATNETMVQRWNGSSWSLQSSPNPEGGERNLESVSCTSQTFCMAVGLATNGGYKPFGLKYNGSSWTLQELAIPAGGTQAWPFAVSCVASRGCQAVGQFWNGTSTIRPFAEDTWRAAAPTVTTTAATSVGEKTATINGTANPNGSETKVYFEWGPTAFYGSKTSESNLGSGTSVVEQGATLTGLSPATVYHYRIVANNENPESSKGSDLTFRTTGPPTVTTSTAAVHESGEGATLKGTVNPNGLSTTYQFEYGTSPGVYTTTVPAIAESAGSGTEEKAVSYTVTGLTKGQTYYYRITATNSAGKSNGSEVPFTTSSVVTLNVGGSPLKSGDPLKVFGTNLKFLSSTMVEHSCAEAEFSGVVSENPGAKQNVSTIKLQNAGGARCSYMPSSNLTVQYLPTTLPTFSYARNEAGEKVVETGKFNLLGYLYSGAVKLFECEWQVEMSGKFAFGVPLEFEFTGTASKTKGGVFCYPSETLSGKFVVTSGGSTVEATP